MFMQTTACTSAPDECGENRSASTRFASPPKRVGPIIAGRKLAVAGLCLSLAASPAAGNWGHWRGDAGNGVSRDATPPTRWSDTENVRWKVPVPGRGSGSPVVWEDRVFVATAVPSADGSRGSGSVRESRDLPRLRFMLFCFERETGDILWQQTAVEATPHQGVHSTNSFASASPCTDGQHVYAHFGSRGLYCYTIDGLLKWKRDDFGQMDTRNSFGEGSSPTLHGDMILVPWDHEGPSHLYALDKSTGQTIWKTERDEPSCWATPLVVEHDGKKQIIMNGQNAARAYDLESGRELWRCGGQTQRPVASAVAGQGLVFVGSGFRGSFLGAFRLDGRGDIEGTDSVVWTIERDTPDIASPLLSSGRLYFYKGKTGLFSCVDAATGRPHYTTARIPGLRNIYASPIAAGGHLYLTGRSGTTVVMEDASELKIVASNSVGETVDATPAPVDDQLFIRGEHHLFCIGQ
jgi:outer membrane protein assembly factor BamB